MNEKDLILKTLAVVDHSEFVQRHSAKSLQEEYFQDKKVDEIEFLLKQIIKDKPELIARTKQAYGGTDFYFYKGTGLIESFLLNGGFAKIEKENEERLSFIKERERIEFEKSKTDLVLAKKTLEEFPKTKWFARIGFVIAVLLAFKELYELIFG